MAGAPKGNKNAARPRVWEAAIRKAIAQHADPEALRKIADNLVAKALNGDQFAITEIGNRLDGKPIQALEGTDGPPLVPPALVVNFPKNNAG